MRVTYLTPSVSRMGGGITHIVQRVAQCVAEQEGGVSVVGLADDFTEQDLPDWKPLVPTVFPRWALGKFGWTPRIPGALEGFHGDGAVLHQHGIWTYLSVVNRRWRHRTGQPTMVSPHGMLEPWALAYSKWKKRTATWLFEWRNLSGCSCIQATSESELGSIRQFGLQPPIVLIPNGVDVPDQREVASPLDPADGRNVLLFLGRVHPKKGILNLLRAWRNVGELHRSWVLVIAGPDEVGHTAEVRGLIEDLGLGNAVRFVGPQYGRHKDAWLRNADAFVLPSFSEGFSIAVLEAMAYRLPVLMSPQCNFPEAVRAGVALTAEPQVETIARGLHTLLEMSATERESLGEKARDFVERHYTWPRIAKRLVEVYKWLLGGGEIPDSVCQR